jgi:AcrR family transcriptional regulator
MPAQRTPDPNRRNPESTKAILDAALTLARDQGWSKVSIEGIAAQAGVGKRTIYRWWPSKGAVVLDAVLALSRSGPEQSMALPDTGDLAADLRTVMRATVAEFADPAFEKPIRALNREIIDDPDLAARYRETLADPVDEAKKARLRSAQRAGQLAADADLDLALELLYAPLYQRWLLRTGPLTPDYADALVDAFLKAMRPDAG